MGAMDHGRLGDVGRSARALGRAAARPRSSRLPDGAPRRRAGLLARVVGRGARPGRRPHPRGRAAIALRPLPDRARHHQRGLLRGRQGRPLPRHQQHRQRRARLPRAVDRGAEARWSASARPRSPTPTSCETDLIVLFGSNVANAQPVVMKYLYLARREGHAGGGGQPVPRARPRALLGAVQRRERDVRHADDRRVLPGQHRRRHRVPRRGPEGARRHRRARRGVHRRAHRRLRRAARRSSTTCRSTSSSGCRARAGPTWSASRRSTRPPTRRSSSGRWASPSTPSARTTCAP